MRSRLWVPVISSLALAGCISSVGSQSIQRDYTPYNQTIAYNQSQQMLLNLVRMRYRESPLFLKVGAVSVSYGFELTGGARAGSVLAEKDYGVEAGGSYSESPTVTYTPISGDKFVKQMLTEVDQSTLILLYRSGWPLETLCNVLVEQIGESVNSEGEPSYAAFQATVNRLATAQRERRLIGVKDKDKVFLQIRDAKGEPEEMIPLESMQLRSFVDIMFFLAKNTRVPPEQQDQVRSSTGNGWLDVNYTRDPPEDALVSVQYNGYFYAIARNDLRSKDTFSLLKLLFEMQAGDIKSVEPVLTLPLARP
jgi:hypothetical protein